jgi:aminopeptidase N
MDIKRWSEVWVNSTGRPVISGDIKYQANSGIDSFIVSQHAEDGSSKTWPQVFDVTFVYPDSVATFSLPLYEHTYKLDEVKGWPKPMAVIYNSNGYGYGVFPLPGEMTEIIPGLGDAVARGYSYINCNENTLNGELTPGEALGLYQKGLLAEDNELILGYLTRVTDHLFWMYLSEDERIKYQEGLLTLLMKRLRGDAPSNIKKTLFSLYKSFAYSKTGREQLYRIWKKDLLIPGLQLNEDDYTSLAMQLAVYGHPKISSILETAREALSNPDKIRRFDFLQPALSQDEDVRAAFFESFRRQENREKENWVLSACYYIHHPLRQGAAEASLPLSLELLPEIAATGDIFFPKAWLDNTIGQYNSARAYTLIQDYLSGALNLNPFLKSKLLQATDDIYRVQQIKKGQQNHGKP